MKRKNKIRKGNKNIERGQNYLENKKIVYSIILLFFLIYTYMLCLEPKFGNLP